jgi:hypothetical protein
MAYVSGGLAEAVDYDQFVTLPGLPPDGANAGSIWGEGYGRIGYGQNNEYILPVATGDLMRTQEWNNLDAILGKIIGHQGDVYDPTIYDPSFTTVVAGTPIRTFTHYNSYVLQAYNNVGNVYATTQAPFAHGVHGVGQPTKSHETSYHGPWGHVSQRTLQFTQDLTFESADSARYFFNAGGKIRLSLSHTGGTSARDSFWNNMVGDMGTISIEYRNTVKYGGAGIPGTDYTILDNLNGGFWAGDPAQELEHYRQYPALQYGYYNYNYNYPNSKSVEMVPPAPNYNYNYGYGGYYYHDYADYIQILVKTSGDAGMLGGLGNVVTITVNLVNGKAITPDSQDMIDGTTTLTLVPLTPGLNFLDDQDPTWDYIDFNGLVSPI